VTARADIVEQTEDYRAGPPPNAPPGNGQPAQAPRERGRVALVAGSGSVASDDLYPLLRRRLLILTSIVAAAFFFGFCVDIGLRTLLPLPADQAETPLQYLVNSWRALVNLFVFGTAAVILWKRPPRSVRALRLLELFVIGTSVVMTLTQAVHAETYGRVVENASQPFEIRQAFVGRYLLAGSLLWSILILAYGTLIPNTWRRCAAVVGVMAASPLMLFAVYAFWLWPLPREIAFQVLVVQGFYLSLAVAIAVFASSRIEVLRQQAADARKLGQYVLRERLGAGGMGEVYRAEHLLLRRPCALKVIRPERAGDPMNLRRFEREVQVTATLTHPNTVQIYDYGHAADGTFYYVMEYLPGPNLEQLVKREGPLKPARAVHLLRQLCGALCEAHAAGLVHRDIKPSNIIVCERGGMADVAKLLDFGMVAVPDAAQALVLTEQYQVLGTPQFMSAEQAAGLSDLDARSDLYSLGVTAYFMLAGKSPFERATPNLMFAAHLRDAVTPLHMLRSDVPADLSAVVGRCLEKEPHQRYPDAASLESALAECQCAGR
jgi:tRNA A-37 threonylcarbamoyl transferase component Bud32